MMHAYDRNLIQSRDGIILLVLGFIMLAAIVFTVYVWKRHAAGADTFPEGESVGPTLQHQPTPFHDKSFPNYDKYGDRNRNYDC